MIDLPEAETAREQAQLQQLDARSDLEARRLALEHITGQPFVALSRLSDTATLPRISLDSRENWVGQAGAHDYPVQLKEIDQRIATLEVKVGSRTSKDVLRAAESLYASQRDLIQARYTAIVVLLPLKGATATLDLDEVAGVNGLLVAATAGEGAGAGAASRELLSGNAVCRQ